MPPFFFSFSSSTPTQPGVTATINIEKRAASGVQVAPEPLMFSVDVSGFDSQPPTGGNVVDDRLHLIEYFWDFDSLNAGGTYVFTAPVNVYSDAANHTSGKKNSRYARGFLASHTYRTPGTYRVSVFCVETSSGKTATATLDVTVGNPDTLFSGTNTIFMSPSGTFTNAPAGAQTMTSGNIEAAYDTYVRGQQTTPKRIMLNRGESYTFDGDNWGIFSGQHVPTVHVVAGPGGAAKPVLNWTGEFNWSDSGANNNKSFVWQDIDFQGTWDSTTDSDPNTGPERGAFRINENGPNIILMDGCSFDGILYSGLDAVVDNSYNHSWFWNDVAFTNKNYGYLGGKYNVLSATGCRFMSDVNSLADATNNQGWNFRFSSLNSRNVIDKCDFFNRQGWSLVGSIIAVQAHVRFNADGGTGSNSKLCVTDNTMEGGYSCISLAATSGNDDRPVNMLVDGNYMLGSYQTVSFIETCQSGLTIRNNIMVMPEFAGSSRISNGPVAFVQLTTNGRSAGTNASEPIRVYSNTFVNTQDQGQSGGAIALVSNSLPFTNVTTENNVNHQPAITSPITTYAPLGDDTNLFTPREIGYRSSTADNTATTATVTTAGATDLFDPETGSSAIAGYTTGLVSDRDWTMRRRGASKAVGATETL
jgi:hypothetical protein